MWVSVPVVSEHLAMTARASSELHHAGLITCRASKTVPSPPTVTKASQWPSSMACTISVACPALCVSLTVTLKPAALKMVWMLWLSNACLDLHCIRCIAISLCVQHLYARQQPMSCKHKHSVFRMLGWLNPRPAEQKDGGTLEHCEKHEKRVNRKSHPRRCKLQ